jgi:2-keto-4-pentenoate hydratase/2-oxohepta-3-ene-1,7-dioic acid hydratase in catechol pathway
MKLATFESDGQRHIGVVDPEGRLIEVTDIVGEDMTRLIRQADHMLPQLTGAVSGNQFPVYEATDVRWLPPVPAPGKVCGIAVDSSSQGCPVFFQKPSSCLAGHREPIRIREYYGSVHPGPGLAVVIGKEARDVDAADASDFIFGYTLFNDITSDAPGEADPSFGVQARGTDTFGCMGPWLAMAREIDNPNDLDMRCAVGGETVAETSTAGYTFKVPELVSYISQFQTLEPGDIISCGTPARSIQDIALTESGSPVEIHIEGLGTLMNKVVVEDQGLGAWRLPG